MMKLSAPIYQLKRRAKLMARNTDVALHEALDDIAREEGFAQWSLLSAHVAAGSLSKTILTQLNDGDMLLLAGHPGHGKTKLGLQLLLDAVQAKKDAVFFTLDFTEEQARKHIHSLRCDVSDSRDRLDIVTSDEICAEYIINHLYGAKRGTLVVVDYLQILDQQRSKPAVAEQVLALSAFAQITGVVFAFIAQIDRSFETSSKRLPDIGDIRMPNLVDLGLFAKACFVHNGEAQLQNMA
jgi:replicative DNA helicase